MLLSAHQPAYLPWLGYFEKIAKADVYVFLDTTQYEKNGFINRNRIKTPQGPLWLTIPVKTKNHIQGSLRATYIDDSQQWRAKHLKSIELNYRKAARFEERFPRIENLIQWRESNLAEYCFHHLQFWLDELAIDTKIIRSSDLPIVSAKSNLVLDLCCHFGANHYLSGSLGRNYLVEEDFERAGIQIEYQNFVPLPYSQLWGGFTPYLSVLDWWMNEPKINQF